MNKFKVVQGANAGRDSLMGTRFTILYAAAAYVFCGLLIVIKSFTMTQTNREASVNDPRMDRDVIQYYVGILSVIVKLHQIHRFRTKIRMLCKCCISTPAPDSSPSERIN